MGATCVNVLGDLACATAVNQEVGADRTAVYSQANPGANAV